MDGIEVWSSAPQAAIADKFRSLRSISHTFSNHAAAPQTDMTGRVPFSPYEPSTTTPGVKGFVSVANPLCLKKRDLRRFRI